MTKALHTVYIKTTVDTFKLAIFCFQSLIGLDNLLSTILLSQISCYKRLTREHESQLFVIWPPFYLYRIRGIFGKHSVW